MPSFILVAGLWIANFLLQAVKLRCNLECMLHEQWQNQPACYSPLGCALLCLVSVRESSGKIRIGTRLWAGLRYPELQCRVFVLGVIFLGNTQLAVTSLFGFLHLFTTVLHSLTAPPIWQPCHRAVFCACKTFGSHPEGPLPPAFGGMVS